MDNNTALLNEVTAKANVWLNGNYDAETKKEVRRMLDNSDKTDLIEAFYKDLEFGTGGLRGIMGVGTNRMNIYTVGAATQGLANYLKLQFKNESQIKVVVGHDCRNNSRLFSETAANIFSANGIKVFLFESLRPTPEMSYTIRELGCQSGIILTASHNPKEYNGYKAYWNDGGQLIPPHDVDVIKEVEKIKSVDEIKFQGNKDLIQIIGKEIDEKYIDCITKLTLSPDSIKRNENMKIVYTPIHGTGVEIIPATLKAFGFKNIINVPEQDVVSGDFPTVVSPNPEEPAALDMAVKKAIATDAELVLASDPDADRVGAAVKNDKGEFILLNGNQTAMILTYYLVRRWKELGKINGKEFVVKTIVTTELIKEIAERNGVICFDVYTGFKWIAAIMRENEGKLNYIGGGEESYGYLPENFVRDKDAVSTCTMLAEVAAWAKDNGMTMYDFLLQIYAEYGFSMNKGISVVKKGKSGADEIKRMMAEFRSNPPKEIAGSPVIMVKDFASLEAKDQNGKVTKLVMPTTSDVIQIFTADSDKISIRPSGTEPKIKFYVEVRGVMKSVEDYDNANQKALEKIEAAKKSLNL
ncbi:MAG TPA: phospho-sugar mutase [Paludibacteraceae bacterium]|nr:phospho-sugar mutase [Paludibacteraceae bacterium]HQF50746.1 phospho-sugar mutase [Paludibacteraceae bacterium]HQJ89228.1 phospho-sugar mutase [Paludibacteraceae bacterium]